MVLDSTLGGSSGGHQPLNGAAAAVPGAGAGPTPLAALAVAARRITDSIDRVIEGKPEVVRLAVVVMLAEGHLLIEDVPGVGKTMLAKALARSIDCSVRRLQFTPDLLPSDVTGVSVYNQETRDFEFRPGAVFANLVVGDEINRASPKTQSALLECMEERQVSVDGTTYKLESPFMVIATQNPIEMEGTYPLPEAQRDRFTARVSMGYPNPEAEMAMLAEHAGNDPLDALRPVSTATEIRSLIAVAATIHVSDAVRRYAVDLVNATRASTDLALGASPRAALQLLRTAKAQSALEGRDYVLPDDLQRLAVPVLAHRLILTAEAQMAQRTAEGIIGDLVRRVPVPVPPERTAGPNRDHSQRTELPGAEPMRTAMRGLTTRGRCLLAAGCAAALCALVLGEKDLLRVAVFLVALPMLSVAMLARTRFKLSCSRGVVPERVAVGQTAEVHLVLHNVSLLPTSLLLLEDELPYTLGGRPRFTVERIGAGQHRTVRYAVRSDVRGRFAVGPLRLRLTDAFGLVELTRSFTARDRLTVVPAVVPLPPAHLPGALMAGGGTTARSVSARGEEDASIREYRHGDDLRKVHWRSTARAGKMMVRREERPWRARATLLLDTRTSAHAGDAPNSSFEWAVTAAASIGVHLLRNGFAVSLLTDVGSPLIGISAEQLLLDALADVRLTRHRGLAGLSPAMRSAAREGTLIAIVGASKDDEAQRLANIRAGLSSSIAVCVDPTSWQALDSAGRDRGAVAAARQARVFGGQGWRVVAADRRTPLPTVWARIGAAGAVVRPTATALGNPQNPAVGQTR